MSEADVRKASGVSPAPTTKRRRDKPVMYRICTSFMSIAGTLFIMWQMGNGVINRD